MMTPVVAFIAGGSAPPGKRMGHAGAMVAQGKDTAAAKKDLRRAAGAVVVETPAEVSRRIKDLL